MFVDGVVEDFLTELSGQFLRGHELL